MCVEKKACGINLALEEEICGIADAMQRKKNRPFSRKEGGYSADSNQVHLYALYIRSH